MTRSMKHPLIVFLLLFLTSCSNEEFKENLIPQAESKFAQDYLDKLRIKDYEFIKSHMHPELLAKVEQNILDQLYSYFPTGELIATELIGSNVHVFNGVWSASFSFESKYTGGWSTSNVSMTKDQDTLLVTSINVYQIPDSQKVLTAFANAEITFTKVLILIFTFVSPILMFITCISVYRTELLNKWRWYLLSFVGIGSVAINWTTGEVFTKVATIKLLGFSATAASEYAPFIFSLTLPIGAIIYWSKRSQLIDKAMANKAIKRDT